jgi:biopolymer transport protein TolR
MAFRRNPFPIIMRQPRHRTIPIFCGIERTPFVNVFVVLATLFLFMVLCTPRPFHEGRRDLPQVGHPISLLHADREDALTVAILRDGQVFFRTDRVNVEELPRRIREGLSQGAERKVYIRADARAKYAWVEEVLDAMRVSGIEDVGFLVDQRRGESAVR